MIDFRVNGGLFFYQDIPAIQVVKTGMDNLRKDVNISITNNVIWKRPKWYQVIKWFTVLKIVIQLPYKESNGG